MNELHGSSILAHASFFAVSSIVSSSSAMEALRLVDSDMVEARPAGGVSRKVLGAAAAVGVFCAGGWAGEHFSAKGPAMAGDDMQGLNQIIAKPKRETCSKRTEDCFAAGCCDVVGKSTLNWKVASRTASTAPWVRTCSHRPAWTASASDARRPSTSRQMVLAQPTGQRRRGRTRSGSPIALGQPLQRCILSRRQRSGSSATRPPLLPSGHRSLGHSFFSTCGALRCSAAENSQLRASLHSSSSVIIDDAALPTSGCSREAKNKA